jgi:predicted MFS family arabinose efflux permease
VSTSASFKSWHYYWLESINAVGVTIFILCIYFWTKEFFHYTETQNLALASFHGLIYIFSSKYGGKFADRYGYDRTLIVCFFLCGLILVLGWIPRWSWMPFLVLGLYTLFVGPTWPTLEAAILHRPGSRSMPDRLGIYNIVWGIGDAVGYFLSGWIVGYPNSILWGAGLLHFFQCAWFWITPKNRNPTDTVHIEVSHQGNHVPRKRKRVFMHIAWLSNALAFLMGAGFYALVPQMQERLGLAPSFTIWLSCSLLLSRGIAFLLFWKWEGWHYHMGWSQAALWSAPVFLTIAFFTAKIWLIFTCLTLMGLAVGLSYSGSLYYSMDYGDNKGEHGGLHESILGIGIFVGPLIASIVSMYYGVLGAQWTIVALAFLVNMVGLGMIYVVNDKPVTE